MSQITHGDVILLNSFKAVPEQPGEVETPLSSDSEEDAPNLTRFGYLFRDLQDDPANLLPKDADIDTGTVARLIKLAKTMVDPDAEDPAFNSTIPSAYTYFGQFVTHDITLEEKTQKDVPFNLPFEPWALDRVREIRNKRTGTLDLDSVYSPPFYNEEQHPLARNGDKMVIERAVGAMGHPDPKDSDLPREKTKLGTKLDRVAKIGDTRNDENLVLSQLHVAFLRAHNAIIDQGKSFEQASKLLRQHYQWIVIEDFLKRIADSTIVEEIRSGAEKIYDPSEDDFFMPLEFTVAAFRFAHSMIRRTYKYNAEPENKNVRLYQLFTPRAMGNYHHIPANWVIQWSEFLDGGSNKARRIDTRMVTPLLVMLDPQGNPKQPEARLAVIDLLRGYLLSMPTGQSVAQALKCPVMSEAELEDVAGAVSDAQKQVLRDNSFTRLTPLWFYILAEAVHFKDGLCLGPVGSKLVAGVLIGLVRRSKDSILREQNWTPTMGNTPGKFDLSDLLQLAGVLT